LQLSEYSKFEFSKPINSCSVDYIKYKQLSGKAKKKSGKLKAVVGKCLSLTGHMTVKDAR
jgi:hypothetical protein